MLSRNLKLSNPSKENLTVVGKTRGRPCSRVSQIGEKILRLIIDLADTQASWRKKYDERRGVILPLEVALFAKDCISCGIVQS